VSGWRVMHVPGHTAGSIALIRDKHRHHRRCPARRSPRTYPASGPPTFAGPGDGPPVRRTDQGNEAAAGSARARATRARVAATGQVTEEYGRRSAAHTPRLFGQ
jgi:hypothetical protein